MPHLSIRIIIEIIPFPLKKKHRTLFGIVKYKFIAHDINDKINSERTINIIIRFIIFKMINF